MSSKRDEVHEQIRKLRAKIDKKKAEYHLAMNQRQKDIKEKKIKDWEDKIEKLAESLPGLREPPKKKKRKAYIEEPDSD